MSPVLASLAGAGIAAGVLCGCTRESVRVALDAQRRADEVHTAVVERQHAALCTLLFRDALARLRDAGLQLDDSHRQQLAEVWSERDLVEFWVLQDERARALRLVGVDAQLYGSQAIADLLWKSWQARAARGGVALADAAGAALAAAARISPEVAADNSDGEHLGGGQVDER